MKRHEAGKGSKQRPGEGYADGWERIWGSGRDKKRSPTAKTGAAGVIGLLGVGRFHFLRTTKKNERPRILHRVHLHTRALQSSAKWPCVSVTVMQKNGRLI